MSIISRTAARIAALTLTGATALLGTTANASAATVVSTGGSGSIAAQCSGGAIGVSLIENPMNGSNTQTMYQQVWVYSYNLNKWTSVYAGYGQTKTFAGTTYTSLAWTGLPSGRYEVYATFSWYTTNGWVSASTYASYSQWSLASYKQVASTTCYA